MPSREWAGSLLHRGGFFDNGNLPPAVGAGVRSLPFKDDDAQVRLDFGRGKNDHGIYLGFGEAF